MVGQPGRVKGAPYP